MRKFLFSSFIVLSIFSMAFLSSAADLKLPNFLENAKVGQWLLFEMQQGMRMRQSVVNVTETEITLKQEVLMNGQPMATQEVKLDRKPNEEGTVNIGGQQVKPKISKGKATVKGKEIDCYVIEYNSQGQNTVSYMSGEIPINGLIKSEMDGKTMLQLIDYGK